MKKVTIRDVARAAGVSVATVSRAINGSDAVTPETQQRIQEVIRTTGYQMPGGEKKVPAESGLIYFIMKRASTNIYSVLLNRQMILEAEKKGLTVISANIEAPQAVMSEEVLKNLRLASQMNVRGVVISGQSEESLSPKVQQYLRGCGLPLVFINRSMSKYSYNRVLTGSERGAYQAVTHFLENGRRHLLMLTLPHHNGKTQGFEHAVREYEGDDLYHQVCTTTDDSYESCARALLDALEQDPEIDGILCCADELAACVLQKLTELGKCVPKEVELIGYNDNLAPLLNPPLSSIHVPLEQIAASAVEMILDEKLHRPGASAKTVLMDPQLILRG